MLLLLGGIGKGNAKASVLSENKAEISMTKAMASEVFATKAETSPSVQADVYPSTAPTATFTGPDGEAVTDESYTGSAPVHAVFEAHPADVDGWNAYYEWRVYKDTAEEPYIIRYEENTNLDFTESGNIRVVLYAKFTQGEQEIESTNEESPFTLSIAESVLQMPNAFSPNGDGINDIYKAKDGYQSITEFHAYIFNRWGQKLFEWSDPSDGWDGTYKGKPVKDGVYFCLVKAKGADGKTYNIKRDVNLLRGFTETTNTGE